MKIRDEDAGDRSTIREITQTAFATAAHSSGSEAAIVDGLRDAGALSLSLVAEENGELLGHVAFSPVAINGRQTDWYGLGPVSVRPDCQKQGIGTALIVQGIARLRDLDAHGCVVLGSPAYYGRFGFVPDANLHLAGVPPEYFMRLVIAGEPASGTVTYHAAFDAT